MMFLGMAPFGQLLAGAVAVRFGAPFTVAAGGILCAAAALIFWTRLDQIHAGVEALIAAEHPGEQGPASPHAVSDVPRPASDVPVPAEAGLD
jgi:hypothetical protein